MENSEALTHRYFQDRRVQLTHSTVRQNMQANMQNMHGPHLWHINIHLASYEWRDRTVYRQQQLFCDHHSDERLTTNSWPVSWSFWLPLGARETPNASCPILKGFFFFFFYQTGHHLQPIDGLLLRNESLLDRCLVSLSYSLQLPVYIHI